jgi:glycosyltransferase involved in cell wall biosynthesis
VAAEVSAGPEVASDLRFKQLLLINEYPPCTQGGAPVTARALFRHYDPERMDVLCCASWYDRVTPEVRETFLPCRHTVVPSHKTTRRPRRLFGPIEATLDCWRVRKIMEMARRIVRERKVEALFSTGYGAEMQHSAYLLSQDLGLPFYYFEMDRVDTLFSSRCGKNLIMKHRREFLRAARKVWLISPAMVRELKQAYGVEGQVLFNFVEWQKYQHAVEHAPPLPADRIRLIYTGSVNSMFYGTMKWFCDWLNRGLDIDGRPVELTVYSAYCPPELLGPHVRWPGLVKSEEIPAKLAEAHIALMLISFTEEQGVKEQIATSVYTKTVDYLAATRPVLLIAPRHAAQVESFGDLSAYVDRLDETEVVKALRRLVDDRGYADDLRRRGLERVRQHHSIEAVQREFLSHFTRPA